MVKGEGLRVKRVRLGIGLEIGLGLGLGVRVTLEWVVRRRVTQKEKSFWADRQ